MYSPAAFAVVLKKSLTKFRIIVPVRFAFFDFFFAQWGDLAFAGNITAAIQFIQRISRQIYSGSDRFWFRGDSFFGGLNFALFALSTFSCCCRLFRPRR